MQLCMCARALVHSTLTTSIVCFSCSVFNVPLLCQFNHVPSCFKCISISAIFRGSGNFFMVPLPLSHVDIDANGEDEVWFALVSASFQWQRSVTNTSLGLSSSPRPPPLKMATIPATLLSESVSKRPIESHYIIFVFWPLNHCSIWNLMS